MKALLSQAALLAGSVLAAAAVAAAPVPASASSAVTTTKCGPGLASTSEYYACLTVNATGTDVHWVSGSWMAHLANQDIATGHWSFTGYGTITFSGWDFQTGDFSYSGSTSDEIWWSTGDFGVGNQIPANAEMCSELHGKAGTVVAKWCGPESDFGVNPVQK
jgi:hypothetical protein